MPQEFLLFKKAKQDTANNEQNEQDKLLEDWNFTSDDLDFNSQETQNKLAEAFEHKRQSFLSLKEDMLNTFYLVKNDNEPLMQIPALRKRLIEMYCYLYFFSDMSEQGCTEVLEYSSALGKLKDTKSWSPERDKLISNVNKVMSVVEAAKFNSDLSFEKFSFLKEQVVSTLEVPEEEFKKHNFHRLRKDMRMILYFMDILNHFCGNPSLAAAVKEYKPIVYAMCKAMDHKKTFAWKQTAQKYISG
ncbi:MAG: hypothetical protein ACKOW9_05835 [Candidatus Paceibacterota bacterium]